MAGRPRKKAEAVTALEDEALSLEMGMFSEMPEQYLERPDYDPLCEAWNDAMDGATLFSIAMQRLGNMLRKKAKITEPGPYEKILLEDGETYKPVGANWSLAKSCLAALRKRRKAQGRYPDGRTGAGVCVAPEAHAGGLISSTNGES